MLLLVSCAVTVPQYYVSTGKQVSNLEIYDFPEIGVQTSLGLGDSLVKKGNVFTTPAIRILEPVVIFDNTKNAPGTLYGAAASADPKTYSIAANTTAKATTYIIHTSESVSSGLETLCYSVPHSGPRGSGYMHWLCKDDKDIFKWHLERRFGCSNELCPEMWPWRKWAGKLIEYSEVDTYSPSHVQELIYNGRVGDELKFIYREFSNDLIRPAFTQEVQYDLSSSDVIGFKELRIKILNATNTEITYIVEKSFQSK